MKYSFVFSYRNREDHLQITIPRIRELFPDAEIIIAEQGDTKKFRRANLLNEGARVATGDIIVLHDIDYYPQDVNYYDGVSDVYLPVKKALFVYNTLEPKPLDKVPSGYRHFKDSVDSNFYGAVSVFKKEAFERINGFSTAFVGWGFEDADLRERVNHYKLTVQRGSGQFLVLDHPDSGPPPGDQDFERNIMMSYQWNVYLDKGLNDDYKPLIQELNLAPQHSALGITKWIQVTQFEKPRPTDKVIFSQFDLED